MRWIEINTVKEIHRRVIKVTGGIDAIRDESLLESAVLVPLATFGGRDLYPDLLTKVAVLLERLTNNHPFVDGNKRTAFVAAATVLKDNGLDLRASQQEVVEFMLAVAEGRLEFKNIKGWIEAHI
ncbi:hypothetical protein MTAT_20130 [Moorella thermoacetica]|uniref:Toxin Doc n=1 Tax=Neomoorella thermoacetica TaxID=1525 RepID=A0AAC9HIT2_NEOTH|nr:type II toxin-antitoxin system death-on-curing family toxin [Moorella thermoacetica]AOQ24668.1 Toxin Doc [Moorella thermoacetica]TYL12771.1 hypothetical protein MTAT_20130 [Moorella thermoacetica]